MTRCPFCLHHVVRHPVNWKINHAASCPVSSGRWTMFFRGAKDERNNTVSEQLSKWNVLDQLTYYRGILYEKRKELTK